MEQATNSVEDGNRTLALIAYGCYASSIIAPVIAPTIGLVINYMSIEKVKDTWIETHHHWMIKTFWWSLPAGIIIAILASLVSIFYFLFLGLVIWYYYRVIKGLVNCVNREPIHSNQPSA